MDSLETVKAVVTFILSFLFVLALAYVSTKLVVAVNIKKFKTKNMKFIEAISVGPQKSLQLIKVANKVVLVGVTKDKIEKIETFDDKDICFEKNEEQQLINFDGIFKKAFDKESKAEDKNDISKK